MNYQTITRTHTDFQAPACLPNATHLLHTYGHLIATNETVRLDTFAERIERQYSNLRSVIEAGEIHRWFDLMRYCKDHLNEFDALPSEFEWEFESYNYDELLKLLGPAAVSYWLTPQRVAG